MAFNFMSAQENFLEHTIQFTPMDRPERSFVQDEYGVALYEKYDSLFENKSYLKAFVKEMVQYKVDYLKSSREYENVKEIELYLSKIATLLGLEQKLGHPLQFKIIRDPDLNAYVYEDGIIYVNIGLLANVDNEAEIAAVLSHETGHISHRHSYKRFLHRKKFVRNQEKITYAPGIIVGVLATSINTKKLSNRLVGQEEEADEDAFKTLRRSQYSYSSFETLFSKFVVSEEKYKNRLAYHKRFTFYYSKTHPNSDKRIESAKKTALEISGQRNFLVDSALFVRLKQRAIDESIHLYFEQLNFDACLEMAFKQHLFYPTDPFYLFYITECTRRLLASNTFYQEALFISGIYEKDYCKKEPALIPKVIFSGGKELPADKRVAWSVFNKIQGPILDISAEKMNEITNTLIQNDTVKFLTYKDAHIYFSSLNRQLGYHFNNYTENETTISKSCLDSIIAGSASKKTYYRYLPAIVNEYKSTNLTNGNILWLTYSFNYISHKNEKGSAKVSFDGDHAYAKLKTFYQEHEIPLSTETDLDFDSYNKISRYLNGVSDQLKTYKWGAMQERPAVTYRLSEVMPELYFLLLKHNYSAVVFSTIDIEDRAVDMGRMKSFQTEWKVHHYVIDAHDNQIRCHAGTMSYFEGTHTIIESPLPIEGRFFQSVLDAAQKQP